MTTGDGTAPDGAAAESLNPDIFRRYGRLLARAVAGLVKPNEVEDVVQETYLRVFQAAQTRPIRSPRAFMLRTAHNIALNNLVRADALNYLTSLPASAEGAEDDDNPMLDKQSEQPALETVLESQQEFKALCQAIRALPRQCRKTFLLRRVYGLSQREVATRLGVSEKTVEKQIAKAMLACLDYMQLRGFARNVRLRALGQSFRAIR